MRFESWHAEGFGILHETGVEGLGPGLVVIEGENGAGKSTTFTLLRALLVGFDRGESAQRKPLNGGKFAARATLRLPDGNRLEIRRDWEAKKGEEAARAALERHLRGTDVKLYRSVFGIGLDLLTNDGELGTFSDRMDSALSGTANVGVPKLIERLEAQAKAVFSLGARNPALNEVYSTYVKAGGTLREAQKKAGDYDDLRADLQRQEAASRGFAQRREAAAQRLAEARRLRAAWADAERLREAQLDLSQALPGKALDAAEQALALYADRIQGLVSRSEAIREWEDSLLAQERAAEIAEQSLTAALREALGDTATPAHLASLDLSERAVGPLRALASDSAAAKEAARQARAAHKDADLRSADAHRAHAEATAALGEAPPTSGLAEAMDEIRALGEQLRRAEGRVEDARRARAAADASRLAAEARAGRIRAVGAGLLLLAGLGAAVAGLQVPGLFALAAVLLLGAGVVWFQTRALAGVPEKAAPDGSAEAERAAADQALRALEERFGRPLRAPADLTGAQQQIHAEDAARRSHEAAVAQVASHAQRAAEAAAEAQRRAAAAEEAQAICRSLEERWKEAREQLGWPAIPAESFEVFLGQLRNARTAGENAERDRQNLQRTRERLNQTRASLNEVRAGLGHAPWPEGTPFGPALTELARLQSSARSLADARRALERHVNKGETAEELTRKLEDAGSEEALQQAEAQAQTALETLQNDERTVNQAVGSLQTELKAREGGEELTRALSLRQSAETEAKDLGQKWMRLKSAETLLRFVSKEFADKHQGPVLEAASAHMATLTGGEVPRLLRDLDGTYRVEERSGTRRGLEALNRSLKERALLALRLGYIDDYARGAGSLPILMDDILVNFDPAHLDYAVQGLAAAAERHQILYFTCHPEVRRRFEATGRAVQVVRLRAGRFEQDEQGPSSCLPL